MDVDLDFGRPGREEANRDSELWRASERKYHALQSEALRQEWSEYYRAQIAAAESMRERAVERLGRLIDDAARGR